MPFVEVKVDSDSKNEEEEEKKRQKAVKMMMMMRTVSQRVLWVLCRGGCVDWDVE